MNISYNWLKDYLSFDFTPQQLSNALTAIGLETNCIKEKEVVRGGLKGLTIGHILTCENHPNSDHLHITTVDLGTGEPQQIVCGAHNIATGQKVIVATIGTILYSGDEVFTIKKSKIRGVESNGMICAEDEIGIGDSHDGIIVLPDNAPVGMPAKNYYKIKSDYILEVDITPNRIDAASHYGVARDLSAYLSAHKTELGTNFDLPLLRKPKIDTFKIEDPTPVIVAKVENTTACLRYSGVTIRNIKIGESPVWLKDRLESIGVRSINNVVDITNYVLHETGQPIHAFDIEKINGNQVIVKTLPEGTSFVTLDSVERKLSKKDLMICNTETGMCIGGVFGGWNSGVSKSTKGIFLESACFNPIWIRRTARYHGLNTDASFRYERGVDPNNTLYALKRAALLILQVAGGTITGEIQDIYPNIINPTIVDFSFQKADNLIGMHISEEIVENILKQLEITILEKKNDNWKLSIPTYRVDVTRDVDVIEEILRIYGYNRVKTDDKLQSTISYQTPTDRNYKLQNLISEQLTGAGFNEILNNSLTACTYYEDLTSLPKAKCVQLRNPLSTDLNVMRQTLLFGGLESIEYNRNRKNPDLKFYEFGNTYFHHPEQLKGDNYLTAIHEEFKLALWLTGNSKTNNWIHPTEKTSVYELKSHVENILLRMGIPTNNITYKPYSNDLVSAGLSIKTFSDQILGILGIVQKTICIKFDIPVEVYFAELNWEALIKQKKSMVKYVEISKFHPVRRDLSLLLDQAVPFVEIEKIAYQTDKKLLKKIILFDVYEGNNLPEGKKSYAVSFILQDGEKTLNDKQIDNLMSRIQKNLEKKLGAMLR